MSDDPSDIERMARVIDGYQQALEMTRESGDADLDQLHSIIDRAASAWCSLEPGIPWEGDLAEAMKAGIAEIERLRARVKTDQVNDRALEDVRGLAGDDVAAALFCFMGWLTRRETVSGPFSGSQGADQAGQLVQRFIDWNEIPAADMATADYTHPDELDDVVEAEGITIEESPEAIAVKITKAVEQIAAQKQLLRLAGELLQRAIAAWSKPPPAWTNSAPPEAEMARQHYEDGWLGACSLIRHETYGFTPTSVLVALVDQAKAAAATHDSGG